MSSAVEDPSPVLLEIDQNVLIVTINRPRSRNAIDRATAEEVSAALDRLDDDPELRVAVLAANGPVFCAGADLKAFARGERGRSDRRGFGGITLLPPRKPVIAAVEGPALGGGFEIVLACDLVIASSRASFGLPEVLRGQIAAGGGLLRLPTRMPYHHAMELALTGASMSASTARDLGLVNHLVEPGRAKIKAIEIAGDIARNAPLAVLASKQVIVESRHWPNSEAFERQELIADPVRRSKDALEGARAFAQKRPPIWVEE